MWKKGAREIPASARTKYLTDGATGSVSLAITKCKQPDEGAYSLHVKNAHGSDSVEAKLLIASGGDSGLDFRAMLKKR